MLVDLTVWLRIKGVRSLGEDVRWSIHSWSMITTQEGKPRHNLEQ